MTVPRHTVSSPDWDDLAAQLQVSPATARSYLRGHVTLPGGRVIRGMLPGASGGRLEEHRLRDALAAQLSGVTEAVLPYGRADAMTSTTVFEVEAYRTWRHGARQVLAYSAQCSLPPALALFGLIHRDALLRLYLKLRDQEPPLALWWWDGRRWEHISARTRCVSMPRGASFGTCRDCSRRYALPPGAVHHCPAVCQRRHAGRDDCPWWHEARERHARRARPGQAMANP